VTSFNLLLCLFFLIVILSWNDFTKPDATLSSTGENNDGLHQAWANMKGLACSECVMMATVDERGR